MKPILILAPVYPLFQAGKTDLGMSLSILVSVTIFAFLGYVALAFVNDRRRMISDTHMAWLFYGLLGIYYVTSTIATILLIRAVPW